MFKKLVGFFEIPLFVAVVMIVAFVLRIPSFFEPYYYGDEMIYLTLGNAIRRGLVLYRDIHDNKPPLLYFVAAIAGNVFWFRAILAGVALFGIALFYKLVRILFPKDKNMQYLAVVVYTIFTTIPLFEGQISNAEIFMLTPVLAGMNLAIRKKQNNLSIFIAGMFFGVATLFKMPAIFDMAVIGLVWFVLLVNGKKSLGDFITKGVSLALGLILVVGLSFIWYYQQGALSWYVQAAFMQNSSYLSSWSGGSSNGLYIRALLLALSYLVLLAFRKKLSREFIFGSGWAFAAIFAASLSGRPYPHYLIQVVPAVAILSAMFVYKKNKEQVWSILSLLVVCSVPVLYNFWYYPVTPYYSRFINFVAMGQDVNEYRNSFAGEVSRNYEIAGMINSVSFESDKLFVWGDSGIAIYALTKRIAPIKYVATYHIADFWDLQGTYDSLANDKPEVVVILPDSPQFPQLSAMVTSDYVLISQVEGAKIYKLINNL
jgi:hypothetical protein